MASLVLLSSAYNCWTVSSTISGLDHCTCLSYLVLGFVCLVADRTRSPQNESYSQFLHISSKCKEPKHKKPAHCSTQNTINSKHPSQWQSIISTSHYLQLQNRILPDRYPVTYSVQNKRTTDQIISMSKSPFWGTIITHALVPIYILQALNMRTCLNQLITSSVTYFILHPNAGIRGFVSEKTNAVQKAVWRGLGKMKVNWQGKRKLWQKRNSGTDYAYISIFWPTPCF